MNKQQFLDNFALQYDEVNSNGAPHLEPAQISVILSRAQEEFVMSKYGPKSNLTKEGAEETEKRIQDLGELVTYKTYTTFSPGQFSNSYSITLPNTLITVGPSDYSDVFWVSLYESAITNQMKCDNSGFIPATVNDVKHSPLQLILRDPFRKPRIKNDDGKILRVRSGNRIHNLITDGTFGLTSYTIGYIKKPTPVDLTISLTSQVSQLAEHTHTELLDITVQLALKWNRETQQFSTEIQTQKIN